MKWFLRRPQLIVPLLAAAFPGGAGRLHLTWRDQHADALEDLFDFENGPSMNTPVVEAQPPTVDCAPARQGRSPCARAAVVTPRT